MQSSPATVAAAQRARRPENILICDDLSGEALDELRKHGFEPQVRLGLKEAELCEAVRDVHALLVRSATKVTRKVIESAPRLAVVGRAGVASTTSMSTPPPSAAWS